MKSLFKIISDYKSSLVSIPVMALISIGLTLVFYIFFNQKRIYKYIMGFAGVIMGLIFLFQGYRLIIEPVGLVLINRAVLLEVFGWVNIFFALILDIFDSIGQDITNRKEKKTKSKNKN